ncbi:MAG: hypothetical protein GY854_03800 [Deltaproteobacteria bacterium]|nr:hypothetical protein [Deltaproteobacteria bacterium]
MWCLRRLVLIMMASAIFVAPPACRRVDALDMSTDYNNSGDTDIDADGDADGDSDTDIDTDTDTDSDTDNDTDADTDADSDTDADTDQETLCLFSCIPQQSCHGTLHPEMSCYNGLVCCEEEGYNSMWTCMICTPPTAQLKKHNVVYYKKKSWLLDLF